MADIRTNGRYGHPTTGRAASQAANGAGSNTTAGTQSPVSTQQTLADEKCATITVTDDGDDGDGQPPAGDGPQLPFIGPLTLQNPRALGAGLLLVGGTIVLSR